MPDLELSDAELARIDRQLDDLRFPEPMVIRALVAETRALRRENARYARDLARIDSIIHHAGNETT